MVLNVNIQSALLTMGTWAVDMIESVKVQGLQASLLSVPILKKRNRRREKTDYNKDEVEAAITQKRKKKASKRTKMIVKTN